MVDQLFQLIQSLSKTEKRYLRIHASQHVRGDENNYLKLYDAINKQQTYDENALVNFLKLDKNKFAVTKNYLYNFILDELISFHDEKSPQHDLYKQLRQAEVLYDKHLIEQAKRIVDKLKKRANDLEDFYLYSRALELEIKMIHLLNNVQEQVRKIRKLVDENKEVWRKLQEIHDYKQLYYMVTCFVLQFGTLNQAEIIQEIEKLHQNPLLQDPQRATTITSLNYLYSIQYRYYQMTGNDEEYHLYSQLQVDLIFANPKILGYTPLFLLSRLHSLLLACIATYKFQDFDRNYEYFEKFELQTKHEESRWRFIKYNVLLQKYLVYCDFEKAATLAKEAGKLFINKEVRVSDMQRTVLLLQSCYLLLIKGEYKIALDYANEILQEESSNLRGDMYNVVLMFDLVLHFELRHYQLLESKIRTARRYLNNQNSLGEPEAKMFAFFNKAIKTTSNKELLILYGELYEELKNLDAQKTPSPIFDFFDLLSWAKAKAEQKTFVAVKIEQKERIGLLV
jgi:hypothetical protein